MSVILAVAVLEPIWRSLVPPFETPLSDPRVAAPVDGPFYVRNASSGYTWSDGHPESLWFHPLLSLLLRLIPGPLNGEHKFWIISVLFGLGAGMVVIRLYSLVYPGRELEPKAACLVLLCPGALSLGVGNPEIPTLFFTSLLLVMVVGRSHTGLIVVVGICAVLTKPTALAMVPAFGVYALFWRRAEDRPRCMLALIAALSLVATMLVWSIYVGIRSGNLGAYWQARASFSEYVPGNPSRFFAQAGAAVSGRGTLRELVLYLAALAAPLASLAIVSADRRSDPSHRNALYSSVLIVVVYSIVIGNPNKTFLYLLTLPGQLVFHLGYLAHDPDNGVRERVPRKLYLIYCLIMMVVFVLGTPLGWYY